MKIPRETRRQRPEASLCSTAFGERWRRAWRLVMTPSCRRSTPASEGGSTLAVCSLRERNRRDEFLPVDKLSTMSCHDRQGGPGTDVDPVARAHRSGLVGCERVGGVVEVGPVRGAEVDNAPTAVSAGYKEGVGVGYTGVFRRTGEVDRRLDPP